MTLAAIDRLKAAKQSADPLVEQYFGIKDVTEADQAKLDSLLGKFQDIKTKFEQGVSYEIEKEAIKPGEPYTVAYVYTPLFLGGIGDVHVCFPAFDTLTDDEQASTLVHEISHYSAGTDNHAYEWETSKWNGLSQEQQLNNADSLSGFARDA